MSKIFKRSLAVALAIVLLICAAPFSGLITVDANAASKKTWLCTKITNGSETRTFTYDEKGNLIKEKWVLSDGDFTATLAKLSYEYDKNGNLIKVSGSNKQKFKYDKNGNLTKDDFATYEYDKNGNITKNNIKQAYCPPGNGVKKYTYDKNGNLTKETLKLSDGSGTETKTYKYDSKGNMTKCTYDSPYYGKTVTSYSYDSKGRVTKISSSDGSETATISYKYDGNGNMTQAAAKMYGETIKSNYKYDKNSNLIKATDTYGIDPDGIKYEYKEFNVSNVKQVINGFDITTVKLVGSSTYSGNSVKPVIAVTTPYQYSMESQCMIRLLQGPDYKVTYSNNKNVGTGKAKVKFMGDYAAFGEVEFNFNINPAGTSISKLEAKSKGFKATWTKQATQTTGYEIQYSTSSKFTAKTTKTVKVTSAKTASKAVSGLKANTKYYVRIRTYKTVNKTNYYSSWSASKNITTKK